MIKITATHGIDADGEEIYHLGIGIYKKCGVCQQKVLDKTVWVEIPIDSTAETIAKALDVLRKKLID